MPTADGNLFDWHDGVPHFRGLLVQRRVVRVVDREIELMSLRDPADLLDEPDFGKRFVEEDRAPYGLELWPASVMLAEKLVHDEPGAGRRAIELGCGLGLVSIAAAMHGWRVLATDNEETALRFARYNAAINQTDVESFELLDWGATRENPRRFDLVLAADVLYQLVDHAPILRSIDALLAPDGAAMIADPNRGVADGFETMAKQHGFRVAVNPVSAPGADGQTAEGRLFALRHI